MLADVTVHVPDFVLGLLCGMVLAVVLIGIYGQWALRKDRHG